MLPLSVLGNWQRELERWCPALKVVKLHGNRAERQATIKDELQGGAKFHVVITTYETLAQESSALKKVQWCYLVIDEAHRLKNEHSKLSTIARLMKAKRRLLLTGTPIQNNLHELWALLNFLYPTIFTSSADFDEGFDAQHGTLQHEMVGRLHRLLQGACCGG